MKTSLPTPLPSFLKRAGFLVAALLSLAAIGRAQVDPAITQAVWKQKYGVLDAQINQQAPYGTWLSQDDDGDGVKNGDELSAGTNPFFKGPSEAHFTLSSLASSPTTLSITFPTVPGKLYQVQSKAALTDATWSNGSLPSVVGDGTPKTFVVPKSSGTFFHLLVADQSSTGDQVSDWAKWILGYSTASSITSQSSYDHTSLGSALSGVQNQVTIAATNPSATQPPDSSTPAANLGQFTITRGGFFQFSTITVNLSVAGTALAGTDYLALPSSVTLLPGVKSVNIPVTAVYNANRKSNVTVMATISPGNVSPPGGPTPNFNGGAYSIGNPMTATVTIYPYGNAAGTGLTGQYYDGASTTYSSPSNFQTLRTTRTDASVDFATTWATAGLPTGTSVTSPAFTARWTGQILTQYSETYNFVVRSADGCKLWVNGQLIIDQWVSSGVTDRTGTIDLIGGVLYDIKLEYLHASATATTNPSEVHLQWYSYDQVKQAIPTNRLYPNATGSAGAAPPAITSPFTATGFVGQPFNFTVTASNGPDTFALTAGSAALPAGLNPITAAGVIAGTPTVAGTTQVTVQATNAAGIGSAGLTIQVLNTGNAITRELWNGLAGPNMSDLRNRIAAQPSPDSTDTITTVLEDTTAYADNTGERIRGYITVPTTGNYYFYLAANGSSATPLTAAELWISDNSESSTIVRRAYVTGTGSASRTWNTQASQQSPWLSLIGGQRYYIEILRNAGVGGTKNVSLGWAQDATGNSAILANNTGVIPSYVLSPWDSPPTATVPGTLFSGNLQASVGVTSTAGGAAFVRLDTTQTQAILHFNYYGLTSGAISRGIYGPKVGNNRPLLFDVDAQEKFHPELRTADGGYTWNISASDATTLKNGGAWFIVKTANYPGVDGETSGALAKASGSQAPPSLPAYVAFSDDHTTDIGASRFLTQATFGPSPTDMAYVKANGFRAWIEYQLALPTTHQLPYVLANLNSDPTNPYPDTLTFNAWWNVSVTAQDQLRQRMAFALSEIQVVSDQGPLNNNGRILTDYYDTLLDNSFGLFRDLLKQVTLDPAMGLYLNMQGNNLGDNTVGRHPNENYAREIMQLFSVGLYRVWPDGTLVLDSTGNPVPTYGQGEITGLARVFTGWNYGQALVSGRLPTSFGPSVNYLDPMVLVPNNHEKGTKVLLDNVMLPATLYTNSGDTSTDPNSAHWITIQTPPSNTVQGSPISTVIKNNYDLAGLRDLDATHDNIVNNPSVGPFICRRLIQRLVTSSPKPEYVYRVVRAFNGERNVDGVATGVRGDMKEVIRAILLDFEARDTTAKSDNQFGKQREPLLRVTGPVRTFPANETRPDGSAATFPLPSTFRQAGYQPILFTTPTAHRLNSGDNLWFDFGLAGNTLPTVGAYSIGNVTPNYTYDNTTGIATVQAPAYQAGDSVTVQFTSGTLAVAPYSTPVSYTVLASPAPTPTTFAIQVAAAGTGPNSQTTNAASLTPNNFTINSGGTVTPSYSGVANTVTISASGYFAGDQLYLKFIPSAAGGLPAGTFDGLYTVATATTSNFTITLAGSPPASSSGVCLIPRYSAGYTVTTTGGVSTITVSSVGNADVNPGDQVQLRFITQFGSPAAISGIYSVVSVIDVNHFTVTSPSVIGNTTLATGNLIVYPITPPPFTRTGSVTVTQGSYTMGFSSDINQSPLNAPTVFNFWYSDYAYPGAIATAGMTTPEFQLTNDTATLGLTNVITAGILNAGNPNGFTSFRGGGGTLVMDFGSYMTSAQTIGNTGSLGGIPTLVNTLGNLLTGGNLQAATATTITNYVANNTNFPFSTPPTNSQMRDRVRAIVQLIITSAEYSIQK